MLYILDQDQKTFPGGEVMPLPDHEFKCDGCDDVRIRASLCNGDQIMALMMIKDAIDRSRRSGIDRRILEIAYFPYARQDRVANEGESLSVKVMADLINGMGFDEVRVLDPHSEAVAAALDNCVVIPPHGPLRECRYTESQVALKSLIESSTLIAPDAGAAKKALSFAQALGNENRILQAGKTRDTETGSITGTWLEDEHAGVTSGRNFAVVDDICDGGRTFIELGKVVRKRYPNLDRLHLHVSHGIFSKGLDPLLEVFDSISTTDSLPQKHEHPNLTVLPAF